MAIAMTWPNSPYRGQIHVPAPVTPFTKAGELMPDAYAEILRWYLETVKVDGLLIAGSNGEGYAMTKEELRQVARVSAQVLKGKIPYYVNATRFSAKGTIARARIAEEEGAHGICVMGHPLIMAATESEIVARFEAVGRACRLPMMVYNSPHYQHFDITADILGKIAQVANVEVLKDGNRDPEHVRRMIVAHNDRFPVLSGHRETLIPSLLLGCGGFVSTGPELFGAKCRDVFEVHTMAPKQRMALHNKYIEIVDAALYDAVPPAGFKAALNLMGLPAGFPRDPVQPLSKEGEAKLRQVLVKYGILEGRAAAAQ